VIETSAASLLQMRGVSKSYGGVAALSKVDFSASTSSIHAVLGENGAGKSTLIKIVSGVVEPDEGSVVFDGQTVSFKSPQAANAVGIVSIFQELSVLPDLSVADNISITRPPKRLGLIDHRAQRRRAEELLARVGCEDVNPRARVGDLPLSRRQMVEIAKALGRNPKLLILDEATEGLAPLVRQEIWRCLTRLKAAGQAILVIDKNVGALLRLADRHVVVEKGRVVWQGSSAELAADRGVQERYLGV